MGTTTALRRALKQRLVPLAERQGFALDQRLMPRAMTFRRAAGAQVHMFSLSWEKYGKPRFAVDFGTCPADGMRFGEEQVPARDVLPSWLPDAGSLQPRRGASSHAWFRQDRPLLQRLLGRSRLRPEAEVVDELIALLAELETYWQSGRPGAHMRHWHIRAPAAPATRRKGDAGGADEG
ncbi:MAG: hypothetical protein IT557_03205 [Alphaproteobacteria bacterium]|nr:hypothetical protein [Alphaproteobacteria bacterium]